MRAMKTVIAVSAGHDSTKKADTLIRRRIRYLNYGLLGLATILKHQGGIDIAVFQADSYEVDALLDLIEKSGINIASDCECFLLSIPSYYSMSWCARFCETVKRRYRKQIVVGGRWVVDNHAVWVRERLKDVDFIIEGFGERKLAQFFHFPGWEKVPDGSGKCFDWIDYRLLYDYRKYQPCVEISRGCGAGCQFCADRSNRRLPNKLVDTVLSELERLDQIYEQYSVYFEAPHFVFERPWVDQLCGGLRSRKCLIPWRCTSRVETVPTELLGMMSDAGLKVLDIGLESASYRQLINMQKTKRPERYLESAEKLLLACAENGVWVKFNLLLYAGETHETVEETVRWLLDRKELIKDISVSSLVYYGNMDSISALKELGASIPAGEDITKTGYVDLDLSGDIDRDTARRLSVEIPKLIANQRDFYDIKAISYFEPDYTYSDFLRDLASCDLSELPFSVEPRA